MFNKTARKEAVAKLKKSLDKHETLRQEVEQASVRLFEHRQRAVEQVIEPVEDYVNQLAHSPKEFDKSVREYRIEIDRFKSTVRRIEKEARKSEKVAGGTGVAGTMAGVGLAAFGPTAAMALATTFGTASTGTAISALSGAAATNAALAWLGGGAVAAGGGGMAVGHLLLRLAGPVGWTISGLTMVGSGLYLSRHNRKTAENATQVRLEVEGQIRSLRVASREIRDLERSTKTHIEGTLSLLDWLDKNAPNDYQQFDPEQKDRLAALINHIRSLSELLRKEIAL